MLTVPLIFPVPNAVQVPPPLPAQVHVALVIAAGKVSVTVAPVTLLGPEFDTTIVYIVNPPGVALVTPSVFVIDRSALEPTVKVSFAVPPVNATSPVAVTASVVFSAAPAVLLVTLTSTAQLAPAAREATFKRALLSPAALAPPAIFVTVPQATGVNVNVVFTKVMPAGNVSGN